MKSPAFEPFPDKLRSRLNFKLIAESRQIPEESLVERLRSGDKSALSYLYDRYSRALYGVVSRILGHEEMSNEVLQDAFIKIWNRFDQYDPARGRLFTWMLNLTRNLAI